MSLSEAQLAKLPPDAFAFLKWQMDWTETARPNQVVPESGWTECGVMSGRGWGKTRVGAEWLGRAIYEDPLGYDSHVICPTFADVKFTAFEGESGLLSVVPPELILDYNKSDLVIRMKNLEGGSATIRGFSAEKPDRLRGPQCARGWLEEISSWLYDEDTYDMYQFGLRLGNNPQTLWTSTPKPKELIRKLSAPKEARLIIRGSTYDNKSNLPVNFFKQLEQYSGTTLGRQEVFGELIDPEEAGIVKRSQFRLWPHDRPLPAFEWIIVSLDTAFTERTIDSKTKDPDATACTVWGTFRHEKRMNVMLLDCWEDHLGLPELIRRTRKEMAQHYGDDADMPVIRPLIGSQHSQNFGRKPDVLLIEDKGSGISLRQMLEREGIIAFPYNPGRADKLTRLHVVSPVFARRLVWLPESDNPERRGKPRNWCEPMLAQLCSFTGSGSIKHDDFVDSCTQTMMFLINKQFLDVSLPQREQREREVEERDRGFEREAQKGAYNNPYSA